MITVKQVYTACDLINDLEALTLSKQAVSSAEICGQDRKYSIHSTHNHQVGRIRVNATKLLKLIDDEIVEMKEELLSLGVDVDDQN